MAHPLAASSHNTHHCWIAALILLATGVAQAQSAGTRRAFDLEFGLQEARTATVNGTEFKYVDRGSGTPIVLVHGQVSAVAKPVMIVEGDSSLPFLRALMKGVADCLPSARRVTIPNASHGMFLDNPEAFNTSVLQFIAENDR